MLAQAAPLEIAENQKENTKRVRDSFKLYLSPDFADKDAGLADTKAELTLTRSAAIKDRAEPKAKILSAERVKDLLAKLPPLPSSNEPAPVATDSATFKTKTQAQSNMSSIPRLQAQEETPAKPGDSRPLQVIHISHRDKVEQIRQLTVTFSKPMVPIGQIAANAAGKYIKLSPQPSGQWQWSDTKTLVFIPEKDRFPQATAYEVTIPDSVASLDGSKLGKAIKWTIETPTVKVRQFFPQPQPHYNESTEEESTEEESTVESLGQCAQPSFSAVFNQEIEPETIIKRISLVANSKSYALRLSKDEELGTKAKGKNWIAFTTVDPLPKNCIATVRFDRNLPSAEGPLRETSKDSPEQTYKVGSASPLLLTTPNLKGQARSKKELEGTTDIRGEVFSFSNPIDPSSFQNDMVKVTPPLAQQKVVLKGNKIIVSGQFDAFSEYRVAFSESITDKSRQRLAPGCIGVIKTGKLSPLVKANKEFQSIQPGKPITPSFWAQGGAKLKVTVRQVKAEDWRDFNLRKAKKPFGKVLSQEVYSVDKKGGDIKLDLSHTLKSKYGHLLVEARLLNSPPETRAIDYTWIQITDMALDSFKPEESSSGGGLTVYANQLIDAAPIEGVVLTLTDTVCSASATSDKNGLATIKIPNHIEFIQTLIGKKGEDSCLLTEICPSAINPGKSRKVWYLTSNRSLYRPGEKCGVKGWVRELKPGKCLVPANCLAVHYELHGLDKKLEGDAMVDSHGGFSFHFSIPKDLPLGRYVLWTYPTSEKKAGYGFETGQLSLNVEEFRKTDIETHLSSPSSFELIEGQDTIITSKASYLAGGLVANSPVHWTVQSCPIFFSPKGWRDYEFESADEREKICDLTAITKTIKGKTNEKGESKLLIKTLANSSKGAMSYCCQATVFDINRQEWSKTLNLVTHPTDTYVGINSPSKVLAPGKWLPLSLVAVDREGTIKSTKVELTIEEYDQNDNIIKTKQESLDITTKAEQLCYKPSAQAKKVKAEVRSALSKGQLQKASIIVDIKPDSENTSFIVDDRRCTLTADKTFYNPGEEAEVTIQTPVYPSKGLLLNSNGQIPPMPLTMEGPAKTIKIPITKDCFPSFSIKVFLVKDADTICEGDLNILLPLSLKRLDLTAKPREPLTSPGKEAVIDLELKDHNNPVVGGQIALAVVDEAVLTLNDYKLNDPLQAFYGSMHNYLEGRHSRNLRRGFWILVHNSRAFTRPVEQSISQAKEPQSVPAFAGNLRRNFSALAFFKPDIETDANGKAQVRFKLPDGITRYRIMAVAESQDKFGTVEDSLTTKLPIAIKPSPPRFLNLGDQAEISMVLQNLTNKEQKVQLALRSDKLDISDPGKEVVVPADERLEVRFPAKAISLGIAQLQCAMTTDTYCDATECSLPVLMPAKSETIAQNGVLGGANEGDAQTLARVEPLVIPDNVFDNLGGLTLSTSNSAISGLADSIKYLRDYPYQFTEQISARLLVLLSMNDQISILPISNEKEKEHTKASIRRDIEQLCSRQEPDGSFRDWEGNSAPRSPFASIQTISALKMAAAQKYAVSERTIELADTYLRDIGKQISGEYDEKSRIALLSYALNVRHRNKDTDSKAAKVLLAQVMPLEKAIGGRGRRERERDKEGEKRSKDTAATLSTEAAAWLLPIIAADKNNKLETENLRKLINSRITVNSTSADVPQDNYNDFDHCLFFSQTRSEAVVLEALMDDQPQSHLIAKLVRSLQECRKNGIWANSQENCRALLALAKYCKRYENQEMKFKTRIWLNDNLLSEVNFAGKENKQASIRVPMNKLKDQKFINIKLEKTGKGKLFYQIALDYTPSVIEGGLNRGFKLERSFEAIDNKADVHRDEQGIWHIKAGARINEVVRLATPGERHHVALVVPLPAGTEASDSKNFATFDNEPEQPDQAITAWVGKENLRDDRVEAFDTMLRAGQYSYKCKLLATTPGCYRVAPAKIEEMYKSEIFGRTSFDTVIIE